MSTERHLTTKSVTPQRKRENPRAFRSLNWAKTVKICSTHKQFISSSPPLCVVRVNIYIFTINKIEVTSSRCDRQEQILVKTSLNQARSNDDDGVTPTTAGWHEAFSVFCLFKFRSPSQITDSPSTTANKLAIAWQYSVCPCTRVPICRVSALVQGQRYGRWHGKMGLRGHS